MMLWFRMCVIAWRLSWPHVLTPWRSPLLRWRLETYGVTDEAGRVLHADELSARIVWRFLLRHGAAWRRFLRWAAELDRPPRRLWRGSVDRESETF
jgi:hypothetical protein